MPEPAHRPDGSVLDGSREPEDTLTFINNPDLWPLGPVLPLIRREPMPGFDGPFGECGVLLAAPGIPRYTVFVGINVVAHTRVIRDLLSGTADAEGTVFMRDYIDAEGIVDDGWKVG